MGPLPPQEHEVIGFDVFGTWVIGDLAMKRVKNSAQRACRGLILLASLRYCRFL